MGCSYKVVKQMPGLDKTMGVFCRKESADELKKWLDEEFLGDDIKYRVDIVNIAKNNYTVIKQYKSGSFFEVISNLTESDAIAIKNLLIKKNESDAHTYEVAKQWSMDYGDEIHYYNQMS